MLRSALGELVRTTFAINRPELPASRPARPASFSPDKSQMRLPPSASGCNLKKKTTSKRAPFSRTRKFMRLPTANPVHQGDPPEVCGALPKESTPPRPSESAMRQPDFRPASFSPGKSSQVRLPPSDSGCNIKKKSHFQARASLAHSQIYASPYREPAPPRRFCQKPADHSQRSPHARALRDPRCVTKFPPLHAINTKQLPYHACKPAPGIPTMRHRRRGATSSQAGFSSVPPMYLIAMHLKIFDKCTLMFYDQYQMRSSRASQKLYQELQYYVSQSL
jgi:hypothetical protein